MNLPNLLTISRLLFPFIVILTYFLNLNANTQGLIVLFFFILLSFTDYLDGVIARKLNLISNFGKVFDPISDKVLTSTSLLFILSYEDKLLIPSMLIIAREFIVSGNREYMLSTKGKSIPVIFLSKLKTTFQFLSITLFLANNLILNYTNISIFNFAYICIWITTILTIYTGIQYSYHTFISKKKKGNK